MLAAHPSLLRLLLWPSIATLLLNVGRLVGQLQGWVPPQSGGALSPFGITWLVPLFGGWFGWRLRRTGSTPRVRRAWSWALLALLVLLGAVVWRFAQVDRGDTSEAAFAALRGHVLIIVGVAVVLALLQFAIWPRLAATLLLYGLGARGTVVAITWLCKLEGWDTHYTKFGPAGIERGLTETLVSAAIAQLGCWVPFTIVGGMVVGCLVAGRRRTA
jgi:hypothetical protein